MSREPPAHSSVAKSLSSPGRLLSPKPHVPHPPWAPAQRKAQGTPSPAAAAAAPNRTGLPDRLKAGVEALSGLAMDDVRVHRNSAEPAKLGALAFARGSDIHLAPGQEQHLPHEAWHVVQQKQGRVPGMAQLKTGIQVNDDAFLEREAGEMGERALASPHPRHENMKGQLIPRSTAAVVQRFTLSAHGNWKYSENELYITAVSSTTTMYARTDATAPRASQKRGSETVGKSRYDLYSPAFDVPEDCGSAMEAIMLGRLPNPERADKSALTVFEGRLKFGLDFELNKTGGANTNLGKEAQADPGQGFVTVRQNEKAGHPHHAAAVVAEDGGDRITLEATAPPSGVSTESITPIYDMYGPKKQSFHATYATKDEYGTDATTSVVTLADPLPRGI